MAEKAIDELHRLANDLWGYSLWNVLDRGSVEKWGAEPCGEKLNDRLRSIADRIEREHAEEFETKDAEIEQLREDLAERHEMTAEAREAVERLRGIDCECSGGGFRNLLMEALSVDWRNSAVSNNGRLRDRLIELIEHGGQGVDVLALRKLTDELSAKIGDVLNESTSKSYRNGAMYGIGDAPDRIRKAVEGAPEKTNTVMRCWPCRTRREAAADWVEPQGDIDAVRDYPKMDGFVATLANDLGVSDDVECGDDLREAVKGVINKYRETLVKIGCMLGYDDGELPLLPEVLLGELDKRLLPQGMEWPRFEDGERIFFGDKCRLGYGHDEPVDIDVFGFMFVENGIHLLDDISEEYQLSLQAPPDSFDTPYKRPEPEVLGADGLPIKVGDTVNNDYTSHAVAEVHASGAPYGGDCPWVRYTDGEWDFANSVTHGVIDTQERIDEDATMPPREYYAKYIGHDVGLKDDAECTEAMVRHLLNRQRELNARTMGGAR